MKRLILLSLGIAMIGVGAFLHQRLKAELRFHIRGLADLQQELDTIEDDDMMSARSRLEEEYAGRGISSYRYHQLSRSKAPFLHLGLIAAGLLCGYIGIRSKSSQSARAMSGGGGQ